MITRLLVFASFDIPQYLMPCPYHHSRYLLWRLFGSRMSIMRNFAVYVSSLTGSLLMRQPLMMMT